MVFQKFISFVRNKFNFRDQILLAIISCCLLGLFIGFVLFSIFSLHDMGELTMATAQSIAEWSGLVLLLFNGTIMQSKYWKYIVGSVFIILLSVVFKIMHLVGAMELLLLGFILLELVYTIRFVNQRYTSISGWFKYGWICSWCFVTVGIMLHRLTEIFMVIPTVLFWITIVCFLQAKLRVAKKYKRM